MNHSKDKQILVTGGTGFLGSDLLRYLLREGYTRVRALRRPDSRVDLVADIAEQIMWVEADLLDIFALEDAMQGVQQLYHCAAIVSFDPRDRDQMRQVNVEGTANVVNAALHAGIEKMVHVSSIAAIGRSKQSNIVNEQNKWERSDYNSEYAISKYLSENEVWRGMAEGLPVAVVNPSVIMGSGRWHEGPQQLFRLVSKNFPFYATGVSGFVDVRDVARFMMQLMESNIKGDRYILNADNLSFQTIMNEIAGHLQRPQPRVRVTPLIQQIAWRVEWLRAQLFGHRPLITREVARHATRSFYYQNDKSLADFPDFEYTPIQQTIAETCRQFRQAAEADFPAQVLPLI